MGYLIIHIQGDTELGNNVLGLLQGGIRLLVVLFFHRFRAFRYEFQATVVEHERQRLRRRGHDLLPSVCFRSINHLHASSIIYEKPLYSLK